MRSLAYLYTASSKTIAMFLWTCNKFRLLSLFSPIVVLKKGLSQRRAENIRSASQDVAGIVLNRVEMLGNSLRSSIGQVIIFNVNPLCFAAQFAVKEKQVNYPGKVMQDC